MVGTQNNPFGDRSFRFPRTSAKRRSRDSLLGGSLETQVTSNPIGNSSDRSSGSACGCPVCSAVGGTGVYSGTGTAPNAASGTYYIDALLPSWMPRWNGSIGSGATVTYSFMTQPPSYYNSGSTERNNFIRLSTEQINGARRALQFWSEVSGLRFVEVADSGSGGQIRFGTANLGSGIGAWAYYPDANAGGDVWLNNLYSQNLTQTNGSYGFLTMLHEVGHAIGLKHPGNYDAGSGGTEGPYLPSAEDNHKYTVMAYAGHPLQGSADPHTPLLYDIAATQYLYGANYSTRSGNDTYSWDPTRNFISAIWDGGGIDTISAANQTIGASINLNAGSFSSIGPRWNGGSERATDNLAIAYGVTIENAVGGAGGDVITGNSVANRLEGNGGNDTLDGWLGNDSLYGGTGNDTLWGYSGMDYMTGNEDNDTLYGEADNDTLDGWSGDDRLYGGTGDDLMWGYTGNDLLNGEAGSDTMRGEAGNDTYFVDAIGDVVVEAAGGGTDLLYSSISITGLASEVENLGLLGSSAINGVGNALNNSLSGNSAANRLEGVDGNDVVWGWGGSDTLYGGFGIDTLYGGDGNDFLDGGTPTAYDSSGDTLYGEGGNDSLLGGNGVDLLDGGAGADTMRGVNGNDTYVVDNVLDTIIETSGTGIETVRASVTWTLAEGTGLDHLILTGSAALNGTGNSVDNQLTGNSANNVLNGMAGVDRLNGNSGEDRLVGGSGNDSLTGGGSKDSFVFDTGAVFTALAAGLDTITDFVSGLDKIVLDKTSFSSLISIVGSGFSRGSEFSSVTTDAAAATSSALIVYNRASGKLFYNQNGSAAGLGTGAQFAALTGNPGIAATDFVLQA